MANKDPLVRTVTDAVSVHHPNVPQEEIEKMAQAALDKTEDAPVQNHRAQLAEKEVSERVTGPTA